MSKSKYDFHRNFAVIIGIDNYSNGIPELETPVADAEELAKILQENYQYEVLKLPNEKATLKELNTLLQGFRQKTLHLPDKTLQIEKNDRLIFYFAGHGIVPTDGLENTDNLGGYLVPQDARGDILLQKQIEINKILLPMQDLHDALTQLPCRHLLVILDCCFAGAFRSSLYREIEPARKVYKQRYDRFIRDKAWQAIASAAHDQKAIDYLGCFGQRGTIGENKHSPFAEALFEGLRGAADTTRREGDGIITATELYCYVRDQVEELTEEYHRRQTPRLFSLKNHDKGEYIFLLPSFDQDKLEDAPALNEENNPYRGLKSYEEEHSSLFFGRDELVKQLYNCVCQLENPLTVVLGVSGSGKSSLVKAGLIPYLRTNNEQGWHIIPTIRPGESPFVALAEVIVGKTEINGSKIDAINSLSETFKQAPQQFIAVIANWRQIPANATLLLVIDQFEELITISKPQEREQFLTFLAEALAAHSQKLHIILTLRSDFEPRFLDSALKSDWVNARFPVRPMRSDELRQAIERPALEKMLDFEPPNLVDKLIDEVGQMPGALSLLSFTLSELYIKCIEADRGNRNLTEADYQDLGGVAGSLTHRATEIYNKLDKAQQVTMQRVILRMLTIGGGEPARRRVPLSELEYIDNAENERVQEIRQRLDKARLTIGGQGTGGEPYVEPAHDALVRGWNKLQEWINQEQENLLLQQRLTSLANDWHINNRPLGLLLPDSERLNKLESILNQESSWLNRRERKFIEESLQQREILQAKLELPQKAEEIESLLSQQPLEGLLLAIQTMGQNLTKLPEAIFDSIVDAGRQAVLLSREQNILKDREGGVTSIAISPDGQYILSGGMDGRLQLWDLEGKSIGKPFEGHEGAITSVSFDLDGQHILSGSADKTLRLWDIDENLKGQLFNGHQNISFQNRLCLFFDSIRFFVNQIDVYQDTGFFSKLRIFRNYKTFLLITSPFLSFLLFMVLNLLYFLPPFLALFIGIITGKAEFKDFTLDGGSISAPVVELPHFLEKIFYSAPIFAFIFCPLMLFIFPVIWFAFLGKEGDVTAVSFSPDGQLIISGGKDGTIRLWNRETHKLKRVMLSHRGGVSSVKFSPDGQFLVSGGQDGLLRLWSRRGNPIGQPFKGHKTAITSVDFSPDGRNIISGSTDGTLRLWDKKVNSIGQPFTGHEWDVTVAKFSPDGQYIISGSKDGTLRLWDRKGHLLGQPFVGHKGAVTSVAVSPDQRCIISGSEDETIRVWDIASDTISIFKKQKAPVNSVAISPDSQLVASGDEDGKIQIWDKQGNPIGKLFGGHDDAVTSLTFSPNGQFIASVSRDRTLRLHDVHGRPIAKPFWRYKHLNSLAEFTLRVYDRLHYFYRARHHWSVVTVGISLLWLLFAILAIKVSTNFVFRLWSGDKFLLRDHFQDKFLLIWFTGCFIALLGNLFKSLASFLDNRFQTSNCITTTLILIPWFFIANATVVSLAFIFLNFIRILISDLTLFDKFVGVGLLVFCGFFLIGSYSVTPSNPKRQGIMTSVAFSPDGNYLVSGSQDRKLYFGVQKLGWLRGILIFDFQLHESAVTSVAPSPDGKYITTSSGDKTLQLWSRKRWGLQPLGQPLRGHEDEVTSIDFSPDGKYLASSSKDRMVRLWMRKGKELKSAGEPMQGHADEVTSVAFFPDGQYIVSGSQDKTIRIWDLEGNLIKDPIVGHKYGVTSLAVSPNGQFIVSSSWDGTIKFWDMEGHLLYEAFQEDENQDEPSLVDLLHIGCNRLHHHPVFKNPETEEQKQACQTCQNYVWESEKGAQKLYEQAIKRIEEENFQAAEDKYFSAAIAILDLVIQFNPDHAGAYYHRGKCYAELNNKQKNIEDFKKAATLYQQQEKTETEEYQEVIKFLNHIQSGFRVQS